MNTLIKSQQMCKVQINKYAITHAVFCVDVWNKQTSVRTNNDFAVILLCRAVQRKLTTWNYIMMYVWPSGNFANNPWANYFWSVRPVYLILHIRVKDEMEESWLPESEQQKLCLNSSDFRLSLVMGGICRTFLQQPKLRH